MGTPESKGPTTFNIRLTWEERVLVWRGVAPHAAVQLLRLPQHVLQQGVAPARAVKAWSMGAALGGPLRRKGVGCGALGEARGLCVPYCGGRAPWRVLQRLD